MYAVIETGGKQYRVAQGDAIEVETLAGDVGAEIELGRVVAIGDGGQIKAGQDVASATVKGTILANDRAAKVTTFKFKRKKQYRKTIGHRQNFTRVQISEISA